MTETGRLDEAIIALRQALALRPNFTEAMISLGNVLKEKGQVVEAISCYRRASELSPENAVAHSNLIFSLHYDSRATPRSIYEECLNYERLHGRPLKPFIRPLGNVADPERPLRIGYVSPDLRNHVIGLFLKPLLAHHDHRQYVIHCYADVRRPDDVTRRLTSFADHWRSIVGMTDEQVAELIRQDGIDVLVDLSLHTRGNRLLVFARKPEVDRFTSWSTREGLHEDVVFAIVDDGRGGLWLSGNHGISRIDKASLLANSRDRRQPLRIEPYGTADGMKSNECSGISQPAGARGADGKLWFPTTRGVVTIDPARIPQNALPPPVHVETLAAGGETHEAAGTLELRPGASNWEIRYTALSLVARQRVRFKYRLFGFDEDWVDRTWMRRFVQFRRELSWRRWLSTFTAW